MIRESNTWEKVREKQQELRILVDESWKNEEYLLAALGESVLRTVEESSSSAENMRNQAASCQIAIEKYCRMAGGTE